MKPPAWVRLCDAVAVVAACLAAFVILFGSFVASLGPAQMSVRSPGRLLFVAAALVAIRHVAFPANPLHRRFITWLRARRADSPAAIAGAALVSRIAVLLVAYFAVLTVGLFTAGVGFELSPDPLLNLPARFDAGWYGGIAQEGYQFQGRFDRQQNIAFFPAFPVMMRAAGHLTGGFEPGVPPLWRLARILWAGVLLSLAAFAWAAVYLVRLARDTIGEDRAVGALALLAAYPFALFFSAPYTESVFLLAAVAAFYHFRREEWLRAAAWGLLAGLTRPNGCLLSVALAVLALDQLQASRGPADTRLRRVAIALAVASASGIGMLAYSTYVHQLTGAWFGWARLHETWGRSFEGLAPVARGIGRIANDGLLHALAGVPFDSLNAVGLLFALAMVWPVTRRLGPAWAVFIVINVIPPLMAGGVLSMGRVTATLFPIFLALSAILPRRALVPTVTAFAIGQGLAAVLFFTWRPLF